MLRDIVLAVRHEMGRLEGLESECKKNNVNLHYQLPEEETLLAETLYITDCQEVGRLLLSENAMVLAWLREENREQDFSRIEYAVEHLEQVEFAYLERVYRRYRKLPWEIARTERCIIREMTEEDLDGIYEVYRHPSITLYMENLYEEREKELEYIRSYIQHAYRFWGYGTWVIETKQEHEIIGRVGFNPRDGFELPELGFVIAKPYQGKGYAFECCRAALEVGRTEHEFEAVQLLVKEENHASRRLGEKLGFVYIDKIVTENEEYCRYQYTYFKAEEGRKEECSF